MLGGGGGGLIFRMGFGGWVSWGTWLTVSIV